MQAFICRYDKNENLLEICQFSISLSGDFSHRKRQNGLCVSAEKSTASETRFEALAWQLITDWDPEDSSEIRRLPLQNVDFLGF